ncbi:unnamed protein product [Dicrocoelium dendriticum]|nr:unnamed protein product [Dicrocoelium dendriticum]
MTGSVLEKLLEARLGCNVCDRQDCLAAVIIWKPLDFVFLRSGTFQSDAGELCSDGDDVADESLEGKESTWELFTQSDRGSICLMASLLQEFWIRFTELEHLIFRSDGPRTICRGLNTGLSRTHKVGDLVGCTLQVSKTLGDLQHSGEAQYCNLQIAGDKGTTTDSAV